MSDTPGDWCSLCDAPVPGERLDQFAVALNEVYGIPCYVTARLTRSEIADTYKSVVAAAKVRGADPS